MWSQVNPHFSIGNVNRNDLASMLDSYINSSRHRELLQFIKKVYKKHIHSPDAPAIIDWAALITEESHNYARQPELLTR